MASDLGDRPRDAAVEPIAFFRYLLRNGVRIGAITVVLTIAGLALLRVTPFPYRSTATVLVDPRAEQVTLQEDVLKPIGSDAAILESMVQILKSDGFLLSVMKELETNGDLKTEVGEQEQLIALSKFKKSLTAERKGATYLVEISYKASTAQEAAKVANSVANSFANTQNGYLSQATQDAARSLSQRLVELRRKLNESEKAVSDFATSHNILYVDTSNTLQMRQLTELSGQLAAAKTAADEARARFQRQSGGADADLVLSTERSAEPQQLSYLRQQRTQLVQTLEQQSLTYGPRHPRLAQTRQLIEGIDGQIRDERLLLTRQLKGALDVAESQQKKLEDDIAKLSSGVLLNDADQVQLEALRREAAADRDIYEKFLSRNKATDELAELKSNSVRVVSDAVPALKSSRPSMLLVAPVLALLSAAAATGMLVLGNAGGIATRVRSRRRVKDEALTVVEATSGPDSTRRARVLGSRSAEPSRSVERNTEASSGLQTQPPYARAPFSVDRRSRDRREPADASAEGGQWGSRSNSLLMMGRA